MRLTQARRDISPARAVSLGAHEAGSSPWLGVSEPIEANMLVLWPSNGSPPLLIASLDVLYPGAAVRETIEDAAGDIGADRIFVAASHTHRAPMTDDSKPNLGKPDPTYMRWLDGVLRDMVHAVLDREAAEDVELFISTSQARHSINRRKYRLFYPARTPIWNAVVNAPNRTGATDEIVTSVSFRNKEGDLLAFLWNYACHPVGYPLKNTVSAHFPHVLRQRLRDVTDNAQLPVLFLQGFSGNTRPSATTTVRSLKGFARKIAVRSRF